MTRLLGFVRRFGAGSALLALALTLAWADGGPDRTIATDRDGVYEQGPWRYELRIANRGTRSEGRFGRLLHGGKQLPRPPARNDFYVTPFGRLYWVGDPIVPFGAHGWMPTPHPGVAPGVELPEPARVPSGPREVRVAVLEPGSGAAGDAAPGGEGGGPLSEAWVRERLERAGVKTPLLCRGWQVLAGGVLTVEDSRRFGFLRLHGAGDGAWGEPVVEIDASGEIAEIERSGKEAALLGQLSFGEAIRLSLFPPGEGERRLLHWRSGGRFGELERWIVLEVRRPGAGTPAPEGSGER